MAKALARISAADAPFVVKHASGLHAVASELAHLHAEMLRVGGDDEARTVRLSVVTIVAACVDVESADLASQTVGHLAETHPARAIIIVADTAGEDSIEADLSLQCAIRSEGEICAEQIRLTVHGEAAYHLASVVTPLLVPDVPVYLWLAGAPPMHQAFGDDAIAICERLIIDSGAYEDVSTTLTTLVQELRGAQGISIADLAWERIRTWRELISQAFDGPQMRPLVGRITRVEIECCGSRPSAQGWLLAGWLASTLGWVSGGGPYIRTMAAEVDGVAEHDISAVRISCVAGSTMGTVTLERREDRLYTTIDIDGGITASRVTSMTSPDIVHLVGSLMEEDVDDPVYMSALQRAATLATKS